MNCVSPPELDNETLLVYLDGEAPPDVLAHIERCSYCRERARHLATLPGQLTHLLYRFECPSTLELGEYHLGMLSETQAKTIRQHLTACTHCSREVAQLEGYLEEVARVPVPGLLERAAERVRVLVATLVSGAPGRGASPLPLAPALVGVRGDEAGPPLVYQADDIQVIVEIEPDTSRPDDNTVMGLALGLDQSPEARYEVHLWQAETLVMTVPVDELGNFVCTGLPRGTYRLVLASSDLEIHVQQLVVGSAPQAHRDCEEP